MTKRIKIVWTTTVSHYDSEYEYTHNFATIDSKAVLDWEEVSDEDYVKLTDSWERIADAIKGKSKLNPLLLVDSEIKSFDCFKALDKYYKDLEVEREWMI